MPTCGPSAVLGRLACSLIETDDPRGYYLAQRVAQFLEFARGTGWINAEMLRRRLVLRQLIRELQDPSNIVTNPPLDAELLSSAITTLTELVEQCDDPRCALWREPTGATQAIGCPSRVTKPRRHRSSDPLRTIEPD